MPADQLVSLAQLSIKAGKYVRGEALIPSIQKQQAKAVLLSETCGANRRKKIQDKCASFNVPLIVLDPSRFDAISSLITGAVAITDDGFARGIVKAAQGKGA